MVAAQPHQVRGLRPQQRQVVRFEPHSDTQRSVRDGAPCRACRWSARASSFEVASSVWTRMASSCRCRRVRLSGMTGMAEAYQPVPRARSPSRTHELRRRSLAPKEVNSLHSPRSPGRSTRPRAAGEGLPQHQLAGAVRRAGAAPRRRTGRARAQDTVARRGHALGDVPPGVHVAASFAGDAAALDWPTG